jgi:3-hydroxy-9,10-secoandrosta-1,3,5(10)-triene-9,17-dione monooxygenase reductase component
MPQWPSQLADSGTARVTSDSFRHFFRLDARGVAVVTAFGSRGPTGSTVTSFCALSANPPLLLVCLTNNSRTLQRMQGKGMFAIHLLRSDQGRLCDLFAKLEEDKSELFAGLDLLVIDGVPVLPNTLAWAVCEVRHSHRGGDHTIVIGKMIRMQCNPGTPLVWQASRQFEIAAISDPLCW